METSILCFNFPNSFRTFQFHLQLYNFISKFLNSFRSFQIHCELSNFISNFPISSRLLSFGLILKFQKFFKILVFGYKTTCRNIYGAKKTKRGTPLLVLPLFSDAGLRSPSPVDPHSLLESVSTRKSRPGFPKAPRLARTMEEVRDSFWSVKVSNLDHKINFIYQNIF